MDKAMRRVGAAFIRSGATTDAGGPIAAEQAMPGGNIGKYLTTEAESKVAGTLALRDDHGGDRQREPAEDLAGDGNKTAERIPTSTC